VTSFNGWADAWGNSWGSGDPNEMHGSASFSINAYLTVNTGEMIGGASMTFTATLTLPLPSIIGGGGNIRSGIFSQHRQPTFEDYLKSTEKEDREYLEKLEISEKAEIFTAIKTEALAPIGNLYHNIENDREKLKLSLINQGIAYREAYLEVYNELVYEYRQAQEDEAIAMVIVAML